MKKIVSLVLCIAMLLCVAPAALAVNEDVTGTVMIYTSMYQFVIDMMDEALKAEFPNLTPGNDGSFFFYGGTGSLQTKLAGEMETGTLGCDMMLVAEPAYSLELKAAGCTATTPPSRKTCASPMTRKATGTLCACATWCWPTIPSSRPPKSCPRPSRSSPRTPA